LTEGQSVPLPVPLTIPEYSILTLPFIRRMGHRDACLNSLNSPGPSATWRALPVIRRKFRDGALRFHAVLLSSALPSDPSPGFPPTRLFDLGRRKLHFPLISSCGDCAACSLPNVPARTILLFGSLVASCRWPGARAGRPAQAICQSADARPSGRLSLACPCRLSERPGPGLRFVLPSSGLAVAAGLG